MTFNHIVHLCKVLITSKNLSGPVQCIYNCLKKILKDAKKFGLLIMRPHKNLRQSGKIT